MNNCIACKVDRINPNATPGDAVVLGFLLIEHEKRRLSYGFTPYKLCDRHCELRSLGKDHAEGQSPGDR